MFETTRMTLISDHNSILAKMFDPDSDRPPAAVNQDGVFLIDACPRAFTVILNWLRYKDVILSKDIQAMEVIPVADFFGLDELCEKLKELKSKRSNLEMELSVGFGVLSRDICRIEDKMRSLVMINSVRK